MVKKISEIGWIGFGILIIALISIFSMHIDGDGHEYLLMTHAFYKHGSPNIIASDAADYLGSQPEGRLDPRVSRGVLSELHKHLQDNKPVAAMGFYPTEGGVFYAMHFWLYSFLAVPFYAVVKWLNLNPAWSFGFLNFTFVGFVYAYLKRSVPEYKYQAFLLFFVMGTIYYLRWTGPEVMSASCVFIASIAILRGEIALAFFMSGLGATQNPSIIFMMPLAFGYGALIYWRPQLACLGKAPSRPSCRDCLLALSGIFLGLMPYAFFQMNFLTPSLIAQYGAYPSLISANRLFSLFLDLNQGMIIGLPGLVFALFPGFFLSDSLHRTRWLTAAILLIIITVVMAVPTLSTGNWNPGGLVMLRYNYWLGMPLLALLILGLILLPRARARAFFFLALFFQGLVLAGQRIEQSSYTQHTPLARWVLRKFPKLYNPEAEIFFERSIGREDRYTIDSEYLYKSGGHPLKLLRHWSNFSETKTGLCPTGRILKGSAVREVGEGWQYLHPPFQCEDVNAGRPYPRIWRIRAEMPKDHSILSSGWSGPEQEGAWSDEIQSVLTLPVPVGEKVRRVRFKGQYYGTQRTSMVTVNGRKLGDYNLANAVVELPVDFAQTGTVQIVLQHPNATSPKSRGRSEDARPLGFFLEAISIE